MENHSWFEGDDPSIAALEEQRCQYAEGGRCLNVKSCNGCQLGELRLDDSIPDESLGSY